MNKKSTSGMTLIEMMVSIGVGSIVFLVLGTVSLHSARSFSAMAEYSDLNRTSRLALDQVSREIRQSRGVLSVSDSSDGTTMIFKIDQAGTDTFSLDYDRPSKTLRQIWPGKKTNTLSTDCVSFKYELFQKTPIPSTFEFVTTTDPARCKLLRLDWVSERKTSHNVTNSLEVQTMKIVIRKKPD